VLPNSAKTEIVVTGNLRAWRHVLKLRTASDAHPQIRALMLGVQRDLVEWLPEVFGE
jgi:thymidylate synthase (FAD)